MKHSIIATLVVKPNARKEVLQALMTHRERCLRDEPGTLQFEVIVPQDEPNNLYLFEVYSSKATFDTHFQAESITRVRAEVGHLIEFLEGIHGNLGTEVIETIA